MPKSAQKSKVLVDAIILYLTDVTNPDEGVYFLGTPSIGQSKYMMDDIIHALTLRKVGFKYWNSNGNQKIIVGNKTLQVVAANNPMPAMIGCRIDALFVQDFYRMPAGFQDFVDLILRPCVIVIQTDSQRRGFDTVEYQQTI
jgi:hypothetical protein